MKYFFFLSGLLAGSASAAIVLPVADAFATAGSVASGAGNPAANYGGGGAMQIAGSGSAKGEIQTLFRFDLSSTVASFNSDYGAGNWTIASVTLQLGTNSGTPGAQPGNTIFSAINTGSFKIDWLANDAWGEGNGMPSGAPTIPTNPPVEGVTFNSLPSLLGAADKTLGTFTYTPVGETNPPTIPAALYPLSLESSFVADLSAGGLVSLRGYAADANVSYLFNSRSFSTAANRPALVVTAVPEPGALTLLGLAAGGWLARRRRHA